jgi:hypothetical protein
VLSGTEKIIGIVFWTGLILINASTAFAGFEPSVQALVRSYPLSGSLDLDLGYSAVVWGQPGNENPWFGYLRPSIGAKTAGSYNSGGAEIAIFPVSFVGFSAGGEAISNGEDYKAYDCEAFNCRGKFWRTYASASLALAAGPVFLVGRGKIEKLKQAPDQSLDFIEPTSGLAARQNGDELKTASGLLGYKVSPTWIVAYTYSWSRMQKVEGQSQTHLGLVVWNIGTWSVAAGAGTFHSELKDKEATGVLRIEWRPVPHVGFL